jgi:site-specific DNA-cytosine methylase
MKKIKTIVSLFDGISCGLQAIKEEGIDFENYFASEIHKPAIKISDSNHPEIIRVGDVRTIDCSKSVKLTFYWEVHHVRISHSWVRNVECLLRKVFKY